MPTLSEVPQAVASLRGTILVAEDDPKVRWLIRTVLQSNGYAVLEAGDGREALALWEEHGPAVDLVMTDVCMPRMGGCELASALRERQPQLPLLIASSFADEELTGPLSYPAGVHLLPKPFGPVALGQLVRQILGR